MAERVVTLPVKMSTSSYVYIMVDFIVVRILSTYNVILRRLTLGVTRTICSPYYLKVKFLTTIAISAR